MRAALLVPTGWRSTPVGRRLVSVALTVGAHLLLFWLLWTLAPAPAPPDEEEPPLATFTVLPSPQAAPRPAPRSAPRAAAATPRSTPPTSLPPPPTRPPTPLPVPVPVPAPTSLARTEAVDSFDLASLSRGRDRPEPAGDSRSLAYGPGEGPGGQRLYNAEWQREPRDAELRTYLPADMPRPAWAMIACRTVENYGVENCRSLGESPLGSGLARAMRQAAWQFRVHPPRLGGKKLVGAWVRIRIDFTVAAAQEP
jgi:protein TonB